eukprot:TRINITY_DN7142_c0_g1_i1.p1 TRINITY_DN7142_c0_g1~~TRINITY_DN7142_c0_g1_i1.p1  ORF type:complete len:475 (-),score=112.25 TRINITY_DN7142_c0_g1_i1:435-1760(-)
MSEGLGNQDSKERALVWKVFLGCLSSPPDMQKWIEEATTERDRYRKLKDKHLDLELEPEEMDPNVNNPLSRNENSPWFQHFKRENLLKIIKQDVERTYPEYDFFEQEWVATILTNVLFVYSSEHSELSYKQGMHELLAPIVYVLAKAQIESPSEAQDSRVLSSSAFLEHDAFLLFEKVMAVTSSWFYTTVEKPEKDEDDFNFGDTEEPTTPLSKKCNYIYNVLLQSLDPTLYTFLCNIDVEPQLYLLRWVRCLFGREFSLEKTLVVWDAIFGYDPELKLIDFVAVAMLIDIRSQLLEQDRNGVLALVFKYPALEASTIITKALSLAIKKNAPLTKPPSVPQQQQQQTQQPQQQQPQQPQQQQPPKSAVDEDAGFVKKAFGWAPVKSKTPPSTPSTPGTSSPLTGSTGAPPPNVSSLSPLSTEVHLTPQQMKELQLDVSASS